MQKITFSRSPLAFPNLRRPFRPVLSAARCALFAMVLWSGSPAAAQDAANGTAAPAEIRVGEYISLTGAQASWGVSTNNAIELAVEEVNKAGGVLGRPVKLIAEDNRSLPGESATVVRKLISSDKVVAVLGEFASSRSLEGGPICQENKIPMISTGATNPKVTDAGDYVFRTCYIDAFQGKLLARFALSKGFKRVVLLTDQKQDHSTGLARIFKEVFTQSGGEIVKEQVYSSGDKDFRAQLTAVKSSKPDAIFCPGYYNEVSLIARQMRQLGIKIPMLGGDGWEGEPLLKVAGKALDGCFFSSHFSAESTEPQVVAFVQSYKAKFGSVPDCQAALGYDTLNLLVDAIRRAGTTEPAKLRDAIAATKDFPGVTGKITLDEHRNANKSAVINVIGEGRYQYLETVNP